MKNVKVDLVIKEFVIGGKFGENCKTSNNSLFHDTACLINYNTIIGLKLGGVIILNNQKYSVTTSKNQNKVRNLCKDCNINIIEVDERTIEVLASSYHGGHDEYKLLNDLMEKLNIA